MLVGRPFDNTPNGVVAGPGKQGVAAGDVLVDPESDGGEDTLGTDATRGYPTRAMISAKYPPG